MNQTSWPHKVDLAAAPRPSERFGPSEGVGKRSSYALDDPSHAK